MFPHRLTVRDVFLAQAGVARDSQFAERTLNR